jgi:hypothetical protein
MAKRRKVKQNGTLEDRLVEEARRLRTEAARLPPGPGREEALDKARQIETAARLSSWLSSPGSELRD